MRVHPAVPKSGAVGATEAAEAQSSVGPGMVWFPGQTPYEAPATPPVGDTSTTVYNGQFRRAMQPSLGDRSVDRFPWVVRGGTRHPIEPRLQRVRIYRNTNAEGVHAGNSVLLPETGPETLPHELLPAATRSNRRALVFYIYLLSQIDAQHSYTSALLLARLLLAK